MSTIKELLITARHLDSVDIVNAIESYPNDQDLGKWLREYAEKRAKSLYKSRSLNIKKKK